MNLLINHITFRLFAFGGAIRDVHSRVFHVDHLRYVFLGIFLVRVDLFPVDVAHRSCVPNCMV